MTTPQHTLQTGRITPSFLAISRLVANLAALLNKAGRSGEERFWSYTDANGKADTSSFRGLL